MKTLIVGASTNPERYSYKAAEKLIAHGHQIILLGLKDEVLFDHQIYTSFNDFKKERIDTVTIYVGPKNQDKIIEPIIALKPRRVIFNPGTENVIFESALQKHGIETMQACTLVLLSIGAY